MAYGMFELYFRTGTGHGKDRPCQLPKPAFADSDNRPTGISPCNAVNHCGETHHPRLPLAASSKRLFTAHTTCFCATVMSKLPLIEHSGNNKLKKHE